MLGSNLDSVLGDEQIGVSKFDLEYIRLFFNRDVKWLLKL